MIKQIQSDEIYLLLTSGNGFKKLGKLGFLKDNSVFFVFPEMSVPGILSESLIDRNKSDVQKVDLGNGGKVTNETVKFMYHPDGNIHFSMEKRIRTEIKTNNVKLENQADCLFECFYENFGTFKNISSQDYNKYKKRGCFRLGYNTIPRVFRISIRRCILKNVNWAGAGVVFYSKNKEIALTMAISEEKNITFNYNKPIFVFRSSVIQQQDKIKFLAAMYPASNYKELRKKIGTVDIV
ncbi:MAG: hypothetical protein PHE88_07820 [Elusimicrobia bacterium]|nr:hypothetical protein [Elusimicrobiota bacterium]